MSQQELCDTVEACALSLSSTHPPTVATTLATDTLTATLQAISIAKNDNKPDVCTGSHCPLPQPQPTIATTAKPSTHCSTNLDPTSLSSSEETETESEYHIEIEEGESAAISPITAPSTPTTTTITPPLSISTNIIRLDIASDTTCPWCFVTKRRISKAINIFHSLSFEASKVRFDIHWHPYQLDPQAPLNPSAKSRVYARKFGADQANFVKSRIVNAAKLEGLSFRGADNVLYCNTLNSHRLIRYARERMGRRLFGNRSGGYFEKGEEEGHEETEDSHAKAKETEEEGEGEGEGEGEEEEQEGEDDDGIDELGNFMEEAMVEELFQSHFERGECGDMPTLQAIARKVLHATTTALKDSRGNHRIVNLTESEEEYQAEMEQELIDVEQYLLTDEDMEDIKEEVRIAKKEMGFQGVPAIVVQNTYLLFGGQDPSTFVEIFKRAVR
ncbi:hypothetical protein BGZ80_008112 [Entomortierella chlamydospora]|uniref:DSBA-like thioredoxin domain-containing protein n=1 Tax=Entomortierella chlamydospora TaxID=101097 RepID=A0A9P6MYZ0_9FUNG|nr:hypothetical protein BGZ79_005670 [Entomortierella chlamydospora]KAG0017619.1 hypothetical protein BGZ80_008112 [Entomortierella chlamydospora]